MEFTIAASSDVGISKKTNQDSVMAKCMNIRGENVVIAVLCDGVGGLAKGEVASATVVKAFDRWMSERLPAIIDAEHFESVIQLEWNALIEKYNTKIREYGMNNHCSLGTTITAILILKGIYYVVNIGDSRTYLINDKVNQITKDQTIVEYELANHIITEEQAAVDSRKSILLQCIGATENLIPEYFWGLVEVDTVFMLCSDGFRHLISNEEIYENLQPGKMLDATCMKQNMDALIELNKQREEKDNISVVTIRTR